MFVVPNYAEFTYTLTLTAHTHTQMPSFVCVCFQLWSAVCKKYLFAFTMLPKVFGHPNISLICEHVIAQQWTSASIFWFWALQQFGTKHVLCPCHVKWLTQLLFDLTFLLPADITNHGWKKNLCYGLNNSIVNVNIGLDLCTKTT